MRLALLLALGVLSLGARLESGQVQSGPAAFSSPRAQTEERALLKVLEGYVHAIEAKDLAGFRAVKPNLSDEEAGRAKKAFDSLRSQAIAITVLSADVQEAEATLKISRRDTINDKIVSSFPQTITLARSREGWTIQAIAGR